MSASYAMSEVFSMAMCAAVTKGVTAFCRRLENVTCPVQVMGVNQLKERISHAHTLDERLTVVEESLDSAVASVASGAIALLAGKMV